jgi:hypothetical protein
LAGFAVDRNSCRLDTGCKPEAGSDARGPRKQEMPHTSMIGFHTGEHLHKVEEHHKVVVHPHKSGGQPHSMIEGLHMQAPLSGVACMGKGEEAPPLQRCKGNCRDSL